jgi:hypothetical protein
MNNPLSIFNDFYDLDTLDRPFVPWLAAGFGIKTGLVENEGRLIFNDQPVDDLGLEFRQISIVEIESSCFFFAPVVSHRFPPSSNYQVVKLSL